MKRIKRAKRKVQIKQAILYILAFVIPFGAFCVVHFPLYPNIILTKIYVAVGIFTVLFWIYCLVLYMWNKLDGYYINKRKKAEEEE